MLHTARCGVRFVVQRAIVGEDATQTMFFYSTRINLASLEHILGQTFSWVTHHKSLSWVLYRVFECPIWRESSYALCVRGCFLPNTHKSSECATLFKNYKSITHNKSFKYNRFCYTFHGYITCVVQTNQDCSLLYCHNNTNFIKSPQTTQQKPFIYALHGPYL